MSLFGGGGGEQDPTPGEEALAAKGANDFNYYQDQFVPLENSFISSLKSTSEDRNRLAGRGVADTAQQVKGADQGIVRSTLGPVGTGLEAGKSVMSRAGLRHAEAPARAGSVQGARTALRAREFDGRQKMVAFGRDLEDGTSMDARSRASTESAAANSRLNNDLARADANWEAAGTAAGYVSSNWNSSTEANNFGSGTNGAFNGFFGPKKA